MVSAFKYIFNSGVTTKGPATLDSSKIRSELGYTESFSSDIEINKTITWLQKNSLKNAKEEETQLAEEDKVKKRHIANL